MFILRSFVLLVLLLYTMWLFPVGVLRFFCPQRAIKSKQGGKAQGYYCIFGLIGNLGTDSVFPIDEASFKGNAEKVRPHF
jgi:hypothetical protein